MGVFDLALTSGEAPRSWRSRQQARVKQRRSHPVGDAGGRTTDRHMPSPCVPDCVGAAGSTNDRNGSHQADALPNPGCRPMPILFRGTARSRNHSMTCRVTAEPDSSRLTSTNARLAASDVHSTGGTVTEERATPRLAASTRPGPASSELHGARVIRVRPIPGRQQGDRRGHGTGRRPVSRGLLVHG